jgi:hypothetical protein
MAITDGCAIGPQALAWARRTRLEKERKDEARKRAGRLYIIRLKDNVNMVLAKGETSYAGKWNNTDLEVMIKMGGGQGHAKKQRWPSASILRNVHTCCGSSYLLVG